ncbi:MAG TPA: ABC transporter permease [Candidatus Limnocylindria bacterium]|nr:ABC transporter permease [Candidatus Limnocylindria bacterium]
MTTQAQAVRGADVARPAGGWLTWENARRNPRILVGGALVLFLVAVAIFAPLLAPYDPIAVNGAVSLEPPSGSHPFGTDDVGRDVLSRVIFGSRVSLSVGLIAVGIGAIVGISLGMAAGYVGGVFDLVSMRLIDALLAFPALLLAIAITAALGPDLRNAMIAIGIVAIPGFTRLSRGQVLATRNREYVEAARTIGCSDLRIVARHIFPNITNPLIVQATLAIAGAMLAEAALSFLGLGAQPPTPTWGADVYYSQRYLSNLKWWMSIGPGIGIFLAVFSFNFFGDALRDALDPRLRRRG